jgi:hypothetical protein
VNLWHFFGAKGDRHWYSIPDDPARLPNPEIDYKHDHTLTGLDISLIEKSINFLTFLDLDQGVVTDTIRHENNAALCRFTTALNLSFKLGKASLHRIDLDLAYQFGNMAHSVGKADISACLIAGDWKWQFRARSDPWLGLGFQIHSGDDGQHPDDVTYFCDYYGSKHRVLGHMDYFLSYVGIKSLGLRGWIFRGGIKPRDELSCKFDLYQFFVDKPIQSAADQSDAYNLGQELDLTINCTVRKGLDAELGLDFFRATRDWQGPGSDVSSYFYLMMSARL